MLAIITTNTKKRVAVNSETNSISDDGFVQIDFHQTHHSSRSSTHRPRMHFDSSQADMRTAASCRSHAPHHVWRRHRSDDRRIETFFFFFFFLFTHSTNVHGRTDGRSSTCRGGGKQYVHFIVSTNWNYDARVCKATICTSHTHRQSTLGPDLS